MDKIDQKLLTELDKNPKISTSKLAKKLRVSQQVADYRLKRLIKDKIVLKTVPIINLAALKQEHYRVFFTFHAKKKYSNEDIFTYLKKKKGIYWAARTGGRFDLCVVLFIYDFNAFSQFLDDFNQKFPGLIKDYKATYVIDHYIYRHKYLGQDYSYIKYNCNDPRSDIDDLDYQILKILSEDCRQSALQMAKPLKVTYKTVINRIKALEEKKIILGYRVYLKSVEQKAFVAVISFTNYNKQTEKDLLAYLARRAEVTQTLRLFGRWDLFLHLRCEDNEKLQDLIIDLRDRFEIIDDYFIIPVFEDIAINLMPV